VHGEKTATSHFGLLPILILNKAVNRVVILEP